MYSYYLSQFPESFYGIRPERRDDYVKAVCRGYDFMKKKSVLICGLARDIEKILPKTISRVHFLGNLFKDFRILIFENDSADNTVKLLKNWREKSNGLLKLYSKKYNKLRFSGRSMDRSEQMAFCRNKLRDFSFSYQEWADFVCLMDLDLEGGFSYNGVASTFGHFADKKWDFVGSNSIFYRQNEAGIERLFYDTWAFRPHRRWFISEEEMDKNNLIRFDRGEPLVKVSSCFGGLAFYRKDTWFHKDSYYTILNEEEKNDCDHPTFHKMLWNAGFKRGFLNPSQITLYNDLGIV